MGIIDILSTVTADLTKPPSAFPTAVFSQLFFYTKQGLSGATAHGSGGGGFMRRNEIRVWGADGLQLYSVLL